VRLEAARADHAEKERDIARLEATHAKQLADEVRRRSQVGGQARRLRAALPPLPLLRVACRMPCCALHPTRGRKPTTALARARASQLG
jgi:hypothetical protein